MFEALSTLPEDPILGLSAACRADSNPNKVDLTVGIYMDDEGRCPVFRSVAEAQRRLAEQETTKAYLPPQGDPAFNEGMRKLVLGAGSPALGAGRVTSIQAPGGCGALRIAAEVVHAARPEAKVWVSDPTWPVHIPLIGSVGLGLERYRYYDPATHGVDFEAMVDDLRKAAAGDLVLLHGCCHNPSGADLSPEQWEIIAAMADRQGFVPFVDIAYQGLGLGLEEDAAGLRVMVERLPEVIIAASASKNMGLYRERTGLAIFVCDGAKGADTVLSHAKVAARRVYSMPPAHGGILAGMVLSDPALRADWQDELLSMCARINRLRSALVATLGEATGRDFGFIERERGMFSFLGLTPEQAGRLRSDHSVYLLDSSRINVAGINDSNLDYVARAVAAVL